MHVGTPRVGSRASAEPDTHMTIATALPPATTDAEIAAQLHELSTKWQPIATAPQHGKIRLWWRNAGEGVGSFAVDEAWTPGSRSPREGWKCDEDEGIPCNQEDCTHWMLQSLPPPGHRFPHVAGQSSEQDRLRTSLAFQLRLSRARQ